MSATGPSSLGVGCAVVLDRLSGLRTDAPYLIGRLAAFRSAPA